MNTDTPDAPLPAGLPSAQEEDKVELADPRTLDPTDVTQTDNGLGVPPFRPAPPKEAPIMSRPPFPSPSTNSASPVAPPGPRIVTPARTPTRDAAERRTLIVGRGITVQGTVQDAERLVIEGTVEAMINATELMIASGGVCKGEIEVEEAEIAGTIDGTLTARGSLHIRGSGKVLGTARCRRLQVEDGGQISGRVEMITEPATGSEPSRQDVESVA